MANVRFSGQTKQMWIEPSVTEIDVKSDLYSGWKNWVNSSSDNMKWEQAFRSVGGDVTAAGQFSPQYFFLMNGWKVVVDGNTNPNVDFALNLYVDGGGDPFTKINGATISNLKSDAAIVATSSAPAALTTEEHNQLMGLVNTDRNGIVSDITGSTTQTLLIERTAEILGLVQSNFSMVNHTYTSSGSLETCVIKTYPTSDDLQLDINPIATYDVDATYDVNGLLNSYKVTKR